MLDPTDRPSFTPFADRMAGDGLPQIAIDAFRRAFEYVAAGGATGIAESYITPLESPPRVDEISRWAATGEAMLGHTAVIKLNGGLGTSMGLAAAKSLLPVRDGLSFLDVIAHQLMAWRERSGATLPLVLMNSYRTRDASLAALAQHPGLAQNLPFDFVQHRVPRIDAQRWTPVDWPSDPDQQWCPPGHGDIYIALASSGMLQQLLDQDIRYAFISNADNLGATPQLAILGWLAHHRIPFAMEVTRRTPADRKGGHLAWRDGHLVLREIAQCPAEDLAAFQDITTHQFFNTNNLWLDLRVLQERLATTPAGLPLPIIRNEKTVVAGDQSPRRCYQLETAMGAAIECFDGAQVIEVPRTRFVPVKTTNDLLTLWSDAYQLASDYRLISTDRDRHPDRTIDLDPRYYGTVTDLQARFRHGAPSLADCKSLTVRGDFNFGPGVTIRGHVQLHNTGTTSRNIAAGTVLEDHAPADL